MIGGSSMYGRSWFGFQVEYRINKSTSRRSAGASVRRTGLYLARIPDDLDLPKHDGGLRRSSPARESLTAALPIK